MEHDPAVIAGVCLVAEKAIMRAIDLSAGTRNQLKGLHPLTIGVNCSSPSVDLFVTVETNGGVAIASYREEATTVAWQEVGRISWLLLRPTILHLH